MTQSLKELKAENAKAEEETATTPQVEEVETEEEAVEEESEQLDEPAEAEEGEAEETETEDWMQGDDQPSNAEKKFTDSDVAAARRKMKAKLEKKDDENERLRAENERLKNAGSQSLEVGAKPKREDFDDNDDPEEAFIEALTDWKIEKSTATTVSNQASNSAKQKQQQQLAQTEKAVDQHYERAVGLAEKSGISAELYQSSDLTVRQMIESIYPKAGDAITDALIASLGDGSERVFYNLGVNKARLGELKSRLEADPSGVKAAMYIGQLNAELKAPQKRKTNAPKPASQIKGDEQGGSKASAAKRKYSEAHKKGDTAAAFRIKREAKKAGANTKEW